MKIKIILIFIVLTGSLTAQWDKNPCEEFNELNSKVRDGLISRDDARDKISGLLPKIKDYFYKNGGTDLTDKDWVFPVEGYTSSSIGGVNGNGYAAKGYDYFDGNKHGGIPHTIFLL